MIRLRFHTEASDLVHQLDSIDFRIYGGVIWNYESGGAIAYYSDKGWNYGGNSYSTVSVEGHCRLLFGIARAPSALSEPIGVFSITDCVLRANGVAFAQYVAESDMWQGLTRPIWWQGMRILADGSMPLSIQESRIPMLNPWDAVPSSADAAFVRPDLIAHLQAMRSEDRSR